MADQGLSSIPKTRRESTDPATWTPVPDQVQVPTSGLAVREGGLFHAALTENVQYLLRSFSVDHMLYPFRVQAGQKNPPGGEAQVKFWDTQLEGSNAGRFLMGAGNTLRWIEHPELRRRLDALVDGIAECRGDDGYVYAFPGDQRMIEGDPGTPWGPAQRSNYARAWITHGLLDAAGAGNSKALGLIRTGHDWFNRCALLPDLPRVMLWYQGHIASTRMYQSPVGTAEDLQVAERWYVVDAWMDRLAARDPDAIWLDGVRDPHCYEITAFEAYLDHYRATGDRRYLDAVDGAWDLLRRHWIHIGGSVALCELTDYPPSSFFISEKKHTGELCGSTFWVKLAQRFHQLRPNEERYVSEIERSIYNVALANLVGDRGFRYHTHLEGFKGTPTSSNTCCEGQGTRLIGTLPEYIYSLAEDGIYVNLFEPSTVEFTVRGRQFRVSQETLFPFDRTVRLQINTPSSSRMRLRVRVPGWARRPMRVEVNGVYAAEGDPGSYLSLDREWQDGDTVEFEVPAELRATRYRGADDVSHRAPRYAFEYGPLLLAVTGPPGKDRPITLQQDPDDFPHWLTPMPGRPLHYTISGHPDHVVMPYWLVKGNQHFSCFPVLAGCVT